MERYKIIWIDNGDKIHRMSGNNPFKLLVLFVRFVKNKYGGR